jgi:signal transduction histidine kinase
MTGEIAPVPRAQWSFRAHMLALVLACILPLTGLAVFIIDQLGEAQRELKQREIVSTARGASASIDQQLYNAEKLLSELAILYPAGGDGLRVFYDRCRAVASQYHGLILLADGSGNQMFNTAQPFGTPLARLAQVEDLRVAMATQERQVSDVFVDPADPEPRVAVILPIPRDRAPMVLMMAFSTELLHDLLKAQGLPQDRLVSAVDRGGTIIARDDHGGVLADTAPGEEAQGMPGDASAASYQFVNKAGRSIYVGAARSRLSGWRVFVGLPQSTVDSPLAKSLRWFTAVAVGVVLFASGIALAIARRLSANMQRLADAARALGQHQLMPAVATTVREVSQLAGALRDAGSELADSDRQLRRSRHHLLRAQRIAGTGSIERNLKTGEIECSDEIFRIIGIKRANFVPTTENFMQIIHEEDRGRVLASRDTAARGMDQPPIEYRMVRPNGDVRVIHREAEPTFDDAGKPIGLFITLKDVTELRAAEQRQRDLERQLQHGQKLEALGTLAGGIAHDLNNTLVPVIGLTKLTMKRLPEASRERANLAIILQAGERARDLVRQILAFSRNEAPTRERLDFAALVTDTLKMVRASIPATIHITETIASVPPMLGDSGQLHQIVVNLVVNAAHAIGDKMGAAAVPSAAESDGPAWIRLSVRDNGCGMDQMTQHRVFEPFFTTKPVGEGTGLGLSVVHGIVVQHGGRVCVESAVGSGARFDVYLPGLAGGERAQPNDAAEAAE